MYFCLCVLQKYNKARYNIEINQRELVIKLHLRILKSPTVNINASKSGRNTATQQFHTEINRRKYYSSTRTFLPTKKQMFFVGLRLNLG